MSNEIVWSRDAVSVTDTHYTMPVARRRFRKELPQMRALGLRAWARRTFNNFACAGKLKGIVEARTP